MDPGLMGHGFKEWAPAYAGALRACAGMTALALAQG